jgi:hypothetical protein
MKKLMLLLCLLLTITLASGCTSNKVASEPGEDDQWDTIYDAYVYTIPLVMVNATMEKITNTVEPTTNQAPINQLYYSKELANASNKGVVTINTDTLYSQAFLDLSNTAMVLVMPQADRFCSGEIMDAYTNSIKIVGSGSDTPEQTTYLLTGPDYTGEIPDNMTQVAMPTNMGWIIVRVLSYGEDDLDNVYALQSQMELMPIENYLSEDVYTPAQGTYSADNDFIPVEHVSAMTPTEFFNTANQLMIDNPPTKEDAAIIEKLSAIGIGPGLNFDASVLGDDGDAKWKSMMDEMQATLVQASEKFIVTWDNWQFDGEPVAEFGTEYDYRALIALNGLGANPVSVAIYPKAATDSNGDLLSGTNHYTIHFDKDELPPVKDKGFWSITVYDGDNFLIDNPINRYSMNDRSPVTYNEDGSLDILVQTETPDDASLANNWLPITYSDFHLYLRIYLPQDFVLNGEWNTPVITKVV